MLKDDYEDAKILHFISRGSSTQLKRHPAEIPSHLNRVSSTSPMESFLFLLLFITAAAELQRGLYRVFVICETFNNVLI